MKRIELIVLTVVTVLISGGQPMFAQRLFTLERAVEEALARNLQIKGAEFQQSLSEQNLFESRMRFFPSFQAGANTSKNWGLSFDQTAGRLVTQSVESAGVQVSGGIELFQGFQRVNQVRANRYQLLASQSQVERVRSDLTLAVVTNYLEALTNLDLYEASQQQLALSRQQLDVMQINVDAGNNTLADLAQANAQVAADELNSTTARNAYDLSLLNLAQLMELDPEEPIQLERPSLAQIRLSAQHPAASVIYAEAVERYPEIRAAIYQTLAAERGIALARGGLFPSLSLSAGIGTNYSSQAVDFATQQFVPFGDQLRRNRGESVGLSLSIPLFQQYRTRIGIRRAKIQYQQAQSNEELTRRNFRKIIHQAVLDLRASEKRLASAEAAYEASKQAFEVINIRFEEGLTTALELSTAQTNRNRAEFDWIQARYELLFRSKVIDFYLGNSMRF